MQLTPREIDLPAGTFTYHEAGDPGAPPLLLLHGLGRDGTDWAPVAEPLAAHRRLVALDQRGHGASIRPGEYSFELMREDAVALLDALDLDRVDLLGHSMGGTVSYLLVQAHPERIDRLVIEDTPPPRHRRGYEEQPEPAEPVPFDWRVLNPILRQLAEPDPAWWAGLTGIRSRTLIVGGGGTSIIDPAELDEVAGELPDARLVVVDGAGHYVHTSKPAEFLAAVTPFLLG